MCSLISSGARDRSTTQIDILDHVGITSEFDVCLVGGIQCCNADFVVGDGTDWIIGISSNKRCGWSIKSTIGNAWIGICCANRNSYTIKWNSSCKVGTTHVVCEWNTGRWCLSFDWWSECDSCESKNGAGNEWLHVCDVYAKLAG